jgi:hypothetical protein
VRRCIVLYSCLHVSAMDSPDVGLGDALFVPRRIARQEV